MSRISIKPTGHRTHPKGYPVDPEKYGDPVNFKYPLDTKKRIRAAISYFNHHGMRVKVRYSLDEWQTIGRRICEAANDKLKNGDHIVGKSGRIQVLAA